MKNIYKKQLPVIIILVILISIAGWVYFNNNSSTYKHRDADFSIPEITRVTEIRIEKTTDTLILYKHADGWLFNKSYPARKKAVEYTLDALSRITVKSAVSRSERNKIISCIQKYGVSVKALDGTKQIKQFSVYADTFQRMVYMMLVGSDKPFLVEIPGFYGNIAGIFNTSDHYWRDKEIIHYLPDKILYLSVEQPKNPNASFRIYNYGGNRFAVKKIKSDQVIKDVIAENLEMYLMNFRDIEVEGFIRNAHKVLDSLQLEKPAYKITLEDVYGNKILLQTYPIRKHNAKAASGKESDMNYFYIIINNKELALAKYTIFDPIFKDISFFTSR
jgi:hypothetical protein